MRRRLKYFQNEKAQKYFRERKGLKIKNKWEAIILPRAKKLKNESVSTLGSIE